MLCVAVLTIAWPWRREWSTAMGAQAFISTFVEPAGGEPDALHEIHRDLALHLDGERRRDARRVVLVLACFRVGSTALAVEVIAWIAALIQQGG